MEFAVCCACANTAKMRNIGIVYYHVKNTKQCINMNLNAIDIYFFNEITLKINYSQKVELDYVTHIE